MNVSSIIRHIATTATHTPPPPPFVYFLLGGVIGYYTEKFRQSDAHYKQRMDLNR